VNTTIDITVICIVYSILQKYTELLKLFNLNQNNILSASSQRLIVIFSGNEKSKVVFSIDQGCRSEYSDYRCATPLWSVLNFEFEFLFLKITVVLGGILFLAQYGINVALVLI